VVLPAHGGGHHVVALAFADMGNNVAAAHGTSMFLRFPKVEAIVMVGIAGGVPNPCCPRIGFVCCLDPRNGCCKGASTGSMNETSAAIDLGTSSPRAPAVQHPPPRTATPDRLGFVSPGSPE
jgi:hypothetical protein